MKINHIYHGDNIEIMKGFADETFDMIFADPPYFMQTSGELIRADTGNKFKGVDDNWDKFDSLEHYDDFSKQWLSECKRILKPNGSIWVIGSFQNIYRLGYILQDLGFWIINDVIWSKSNPVPNFNGTRLCNAHETLIWLTKDKKSKPTFNYKTLKFLNNNKQERSVWEFPVCNGNERLKDKNGKKVHSTQKPESLLERILLTSSKPQDMILDPFMGSGTTGAVAKKLGRNFVGIERNADYINHARNRINDIKDCSNDISNLSLEIKPPKIPMTKLLEIGLIQENQAIYDAKKQVCGYITSLGLIQDLNGSELSIHKLGARLSNKKSVNGWSYFYLKSSKGDLILLDSLRYKAINQNN